MKTYEYNPKHKIGTCAKCGGEMIYNVPRLGASGGFIHKETGYISCGNTYVNKHILIDFRKMPKYK